jgi:hypothetical protein
MKDQSLPLRKRNGEAISSASVISISYYIVRVKHTGLSPLFDSVVKFRRHADMDADLVEGGWVRGWYYRRSNDHYCLLLLVYESSAEVEALESGRDYGGVLPVIDGR